jgi:hypothetical protein
MKGLLLAAALGAFAPPGKLLVEAPPFGSAMGEPNGRITRLGGWYDTAWSPDGTRVAGSDGRRVGVIGMWSLRRSLPTQPVWSSDGALLAYVSDRAIRVVRADGRGDRTVGHGERAAWRPGTHELAYVDHRGAIALRDVDRSRTLWRAPPALRVRPGGLLWSPRGGRLVAISGSYVRVLGPRGGIVRRVTAGRRGHFQFGTYLGSELVLVRHRFRDGTTYVTRGRETLIHDRGSVVDITASPDGTRLLLGRRSRNQWQFWPAAPALAGVTRGVNPEADGVWAFPRVRGWRLVNG